MADQDFIYVRERRLPYETFDADNHLYENRDALTKFLPPGVRGRHQVRRRRRPHQARASATTSATTSRTRPSSRVAVPGGCGHRRHEGRRGRRRARRTRRRSRMAMPSIDAFFDPEPRLELMKDMGIDRTLLWPTLASVLEERVADDPDVAVAVIHALNEWMHEHWTYVYSDAIYATPIISLAAGNDVAHRGARVHPRARRQDLPDPGRARCRRGRAASRSRCRSSTRSGSGCRSSTSSSACTPATPATSRYLNEWEGIGDRRCIAVRGRRASPAFLAHGVGEGQPGQTRWRRSSATASPPGSRSSSSCRSSSGRRGSGRSYEQLQARLRAVAGALRRGPVRGVQPQRLGAHLPRARPEGPHRPRHPGRPHHVRLRLPPPRGHGRPARPTPRCVDDLSAEDQELIMGGTIAQALKVGKYAQA